MRIFNFLLAITFLAFAFMKISDPQPIAWILMYGAMAVICIMAMFQVYYKWLILITLISMLYYAASVHIGAREWVHANGAVCHEEARDFFELALAILILLFQFIRSFRRT